MRQPTKKELRDRVNELVTELTIARANEAHTKQQLEATSEELINTRRSLRDAEDELILVYESCRDAEITPTENPNVEQL